MRRNGLKASLRSSLFSALAILLTVLLTMSFLTLSVCAADSAEAGKDSDFNWPIITISAAVLIDVVILLVCFKKRKAMDAAAVVAAADIAPEPEPEPVKTMPRFVSIVKEISVDKADVLMSDEMAAKLIEESAESGDKGKMGIINLGVISANFRADDVVTLDDLKAKGLINAKYDRIKILASGCLDKPLTIKAHAFSLQAVKMLFLTGGHAVKLSSDD